MPSFSGIAVSILGVLVLTCFGLLGFSAWEERRIASRYPPEGKFVEIAGARLHYSERLPAGRVRETIVLLHGASGSQADMMLPLGDRLAARGFRVLAFDRPGLGWSDRPEGLVADAPAAQARDIRAGLEHLGVKGAIIVGHSLAGVVATNFALDQSDFTRGLVLLAPVTHPWPGGDIDWYYGIAANAWTGWLFTHLLTMPVGLATIDRALVSVFAPQPVPDDYASRTGVELVLRPDSFRANAWDVSGTYGIVSAQAPRLHEITAPTAIVTGDHDNIVLTAVHSYGSARDIPGATLTVLPGVGHSPHWAAPETVVREIERVADRAHARLLQVAH
jgi:pimeloyl-ACP methyl ester carboxylesterase